MWRADQGRGWVVTMSGERREQFGRRADDLAIAILGEERGDQREQTGFDDAAAAFTAERAMPCGWLVRKCVMQIRRHQSMASGEAEENEVAEDCRQSPQRHFRGVSGQPAEKF